MAWVSVHEQVDGGKLRLLRKEIGCSKLEALGILVQLWLWGLDNAERSGALRSADVEDVAEVFAFGLSKGIKSSAVVEALIKTGWLDDEDGILFIHDWADWQEQWYRALDRREKDRVRKRGTSAETPTEHPQNFQRNSTEVPARFRGNSSEIPDTPSPSSSSSSSPSSNEGVAASPPRASRGEPMTAKVVPFSGELQTAFDEWLAYKREKRQPYKPTGLRNLTTQIRNAAEQYGEHAVADIIRTSMASNYQGIVFDRLRKGATGGVDSMSFAEMYRSGAFDE